MIVFHPFPTSPKSDPRKIQSSFDYSIFEIVRLTASVQLRSAFWENTVSIALQTDGQDRRNLEVLQRGIGLKC